MWLKAGFLDERQRVLGDLQDERHDRDGRSQVGHSAQPRDGSRRISRNRSGSDTLSDGLTNNNRGRKNDRVKRSQNFAVGSNYVAAPTPTQWAKRARRGLIEEL